MNPFPYKGIDKVVVWFTLRIFLFIVIAKKPYEPTRFMVECEGCSDWFHRLCEKVPKKVTEKRDRKKPNLFLKIVEWNELLIFK